MQRVLITFLVLFNMLSISVSVEAITLNEFLNQKEISSLIIKDYNSYVSDKNTLFEPDINQLDRVITIFIEGINDELVTKGKNWKETIIDTSRVYIVLECIKAVDILVYREISLNKSAFSNEYESVYKECYGIGHLLITEGLLECSIEDFMNNLNKVMELVVSIESKVQVDKIRVLLKKNKRIRDRFCKALLADDYDFQGDEYNYLLASNKMYDIYFGDFICTLAASGALKKYYDKKTDGDSYTTVIDLDGETLYLKFDKEKSNPNLLVLQKILDKSGKSEDIKNIHHMNFILKPLILYSWIRSQARYSRIFK